MSIRHHMAPDKRVDVLFAERWRALVNEQWDTWWATMTAPGVPSAWETLEAAVTDVVRHHGQQLMEPLAVVPAPRPCWAVGQAPLRQVDPARPITVTGLWGEYHLTRAYYVCPAGHGSATPADAAWGLGRAHVTPALAAHLCRLVVERPFDRAAAMAQELLGVAVDGETLRRLAEGVGHVPEPTGPGPAGLLVALDGAMVHPDGAWHEVPVGVCQALEPRPVDGWEPVGPPDYCVEVSGRSAFWARLYAHAAAAGVESRHCQRVVVMGDGAHWIWEEAPTYFGGAGKEVIEIVDFYHAAEHVWTVAHALYPADEAGAAAWAKPLVTALREQGPAPVQAALAAVHPDDPGGAAVVERERGYFAYHAARMDYPRYQREGLPLGAGRVDSACTVVLKQRLSQGGMRWTRAGAQAVATLRAWHRSGRWAALWASRPLIQRVPPKRRCAA